MDKTSVSDGKLHFCQKGINMAHLCGSALHAAKVTCTPLIIEKFLMEKQSSDLHAFVAGFACKDLGSWCNLVTCF